MKHKNNQTEKSANISNNTNKKDQNEKTYTLNSVIHKLNKSEPNIFGNFFIDFSEIFNDTNNNPQNYMKKCVSLSNSDLVEKKISKNIFENNSLKPTYFEKFHIETLFYIFYYMPRDALQNYAADELNKRKWKYHVDLALWFSLENQSEDKLDNFYYFNPNEWKICKYGYGPLNKNSFMPENDILKLVKVQNSKSQNNGSGNNPQSHPQHN